ncbi:MAG: hypothetical protein NC419_05535 [Muribaculaceae bacterium]|nr:hypothetical protein [Muribaculaceae bacterium]
MKKSRYFMTAMLCLSLTACANAAETESNIADTGEVTTDTLTADETATGESDVDGTATDTSNTGETTTDASWQTTNSETDMEESDTSQQDPDTNATDATQQEADTPQSESPYYLIENPSQEYYLTESLIPEAEYTVSLEQLTQESNEIIDTEEWFSDNELARVNSTYIEDDTYSYILSGDNGFYAYLLDIYRKEDGAYLGQLDFSDYRYTDNIKKGDEDFVEQKIWWVQSVDNVLYVAIGHYTYTESCPHTGYLVAIDLEDMHVIWKSEPCVTNGQTFEIIRDTIVCGYGFTSEPDYLNLVNRLDGSVIEKIPIKSMADYIIRKGDVLYVRTYNTNYTFRISEAVSCN